MGVERILIGVDGSEGAQRALRTGADLAAVTRARVFAVHVVSNTWLIELAALQFDTRPLIHNARAQLVGPWTAVLRDLGVDYSTDALNGDPGAVLVEYAGSHHADLIIVGASRHSSLRNDILGGTAHRVVNRSTIPVLIVPTPQEERKDRWVPIPG
jgi:nucleotide-binding universal stress UspA family protein